MLQISNISILFLRSIWRWRMTRTPSRSWTCRRPTWRVNWRSLAPSWAMPSRRAATWARWRRSSRPTSATWATSWPRWRPSSAGRTRRASQRRTRSASCRTRWPRRTRMWRGWIRRRGGWRRRARLVLSSCSRRRTRWLFLNFILK